MKKKLLSMICILALVFTSVVPASAMEMPVNSVPTPVTADVLHINPVYKDVIDEESLVTELAEASQYAVQPRAGVEYLTEESEVASALRQAMVNRQENVTIGYEGTQYTQEKHDEIVSLALMETDSPKEGDYLAFQYGGCVASISYYPMNGVYYSTITYSISYYTTAEQELEMDAAVERVLNEIGITWNMGNYEKVCKIYDYICSHVTYDYANLENKDYKLKYTAYAALVNGTAVCQGYANLFYRLAKEAGLSTRIVRGWQTSSGGGHAWNIVKLGEQYYNLDATWDSAYVEAGLDYAFFLKGWTTFEDHTFDADYTTEAFLTEYPMSTEAYVHVPGNETEEPKDISEVEANLSQDTFAYNGSSHMPDVIIEGLEKGIDYEVEYRDNVYAGQATVVVCGIGKYCGEITLPFTIEPANIANVDVFLDQTVYRYIGKPVQPVVNVGSLVEGKDFEISYSNNNGVGTGAIVLTGKGNYTGTKTVEFEILECEHQWGSGIVTLEPNCAREGVRTYTCALCQDKKTESIPVNDDHNMSEWVVDGEATCGETGLKIRTCQNGCGKRDEEVVPALPHTPVEDAAVAATCVKPGLTAGSHCGVCGETITAQKETAVDPDNHKMSDWNIETQATCGKAGLQSRGCQNGCGHKEEKLLPATGKHDMTAEGDLAPTCVADGYYGKVYCKNCDYVEREHEVLPATGKHSFGDWVETKEATCKDAGKKTRECIVCEKAETDTIPVLPHTPVEDAAVAATCVKPGLTAGSHCGVCGEILTAQKETAVDSENHSFTKYVSNQDATCAADGTKTAKCDNCTETKTVADVGSKKKHTEKTDVVKATTTSEGSIVTKCADCKEVLNTAVIPAIENIALSYKQKVYTGKAIDAPELTVTDTAGKKITSYDVTGLEKQTQVGCYKVTVTFKGNYEGSTDLHFTIVPKKVSSASANLNSASATGGYNDIKFTWKAATGASGYLVYYKKASTNKWSSAASTTKTSYTKKDLAAGTKYSFKVVPYYKESGKTTKYYDTTQYRTASTTTLKKLTGVKVVKSGTKVKVSWSNIAGETGYQISKMTKKSATQKTPTTVKSTTAKSKLLTATKGKTYYYKVRAYKVVDGKKVYGPWSDVKAYKRK